MADEAAHVWTIAKFLSAVAGDPHDAHLLAAAQRSHTGSRLAHSADAEGAHADEMCSRHSCRGARPQPRNSRFSGFQLNILSGAYRDSRQARIVALWLNGA